MPNRETQANKQETSPVKRKAESQESGKAKLKPESLDSRSDISPLPSTADSSNKSSDSESETSFSSFTYTISAPSTTKSASLSPEIHYTEDSASSEYITNSSSDESFVPHPPKHSEAPKSPHTPTQSPTKKTNLFLSPASPNPTTAISKTSLPLIVGISPEDGELQIQSSA